MCHPHWRWDRGAEFQCPGIKGINLVHLGLVLIIRRLVIFPAVVLFCADFTGRTSQATTINPQPIETTNTPTVRWRVCSRLLIRSYSPKFQERAKVSWLFWLVKLHRGGFLHGYRRRRSWWCHQILGLGWPKVGILKGPMHRRQRTPSQVHIVAIPFAMGQHLLLDINPELVLLLSKAISQLREICLGRTAIWSYGHTKLGRWWGSLDGRGLWRFSFLGLETGQYPLRVVAVGEGMID